MSRQNRQLKQLDRVKASLSHTKRYLFFFLEKQILTNFHLTVDRLTGFLSRGDDGHFVLCFFSSAKKSLFIQIAHYSLSLTRTMGLEKKFSAREKVESEY